jgi:hypothetical protein
MGSNKTETNKLKFLESLFLNAPIENFDSSTLAFFEKNTSFKHLIKKGDYTAITHEGNVKVFLQHNFYFENNSVIPNLFDSGVIRFNIIETNGTNNILSIDLELVCKKIQNSESLYSYIDSSLKLTNKTIIEDGSTIIYTKKDFDDFTTIRISFKKVVNVFSAVFYEIDLDGN